ncbi:type IV pilus assembly protein PilX [Variovorax sp. OK605]|jgi:type IV pilus assembly protein PilX|uniref:pilus assembly PilX family protein n=1 Tax=unclassified Variovorax TaxID=663243 RepID=UPI0008D1DAF4|nr:MULTISPECIES: pilus assembly protein [unclassified Variovorax]SEK02676.1 type IV pilus assembly protein PilX [Variovorax sp. OK202]SFD34583.1 type IV pilus assembly protein PilX [Variovorax sp. OK212]SFP73580.1 type IV pilus assembly protein PilX [Variovorax sp. OK605]
MSRSVHRPPRGFSLIVVLLMLLVVTVLALGAAQTSLVSERSARNDRDTEVAFQAAEAALLDAESDVLGPNDSARQRLCLFSSRDISAFAAGCAGGGDRQGLCAPGEPGAEPAWMTADFSADAGKSVAYGAFTGQVYLSGDAATGSRAGALPARAPRYIVEALRSHGNWQPDLLQNASADGAHYLFRVTAIGYGMREETQVVLQTTLSKPAPSPGCLS